MSRMSQGYLPPKLHQSIEQCDRSQRRSLRNGDINAKEPDPAWESCDQLLDQGKTPELLSVLALLNELGLKLSVTAKEELPV